MKDNSNALTSAVVANNVFNSVKNANANINISN